MTNVGIWRVTVGVERGESGGAVLELAQQVDESKLDNVSSRRASFLAPGSPPLLGAALAMSSPCVTRVLRN
jgi:hypothetical protein